MKEIVSTNWLFKNKDNKNLVILDCSWYMPAIKRNPYKEFKSSHIKGSFFFDINKISNQETKLPHMLPSISLFTKKVRNFDIHKGTQIITYSKDDITGAARAWWMFKYFGFDNVSVLNGGLIKWKREKKPLSVSRSKTKISSYKFNICKSWLLVKSDINKQINKKKLILIDARNPKRFKGLENEPRKEKKKGNIKGSKNIFWQETLKNNNSLFINKKKLIKIFINYSKLKIKFGFSCGSGMSACVLSLSLKYALDIKSSVYDGSWAEWGLINKIR